MDLGISLNVYNDLIWHRKRVKPLLSDQNIVRKFLRNALSVSLVVSKQTKPINLQAAKNLLRDVWKFGQDLKINDVGEGLIQFKFSLESQLVWVMNNSPWSFDNHLLLLRQWGKGDDGILCWLLTRPYMGAGMGTSFRTYQWRSG